MKTLTTSTKRIILQVFFTCFILFLLLAGRHEQTLMPCESFTTPHKEYFKQNVEPRTEPDSGTEKSNNVTTPAIMIGLPVLN